MSRFTPAAHLLSENITLERPTVPFLGGRRPLHVLIVGGSHSALFAAILLKRQGHNVRILERATSSTRSGRAAGLGLGGWVKRFFDETDRLAGIPFGVPNEFLNVLDLDLNTKKQLRLDYRMTSWDAVYYRLRANFNGLESGYCPHAPAMDANEGDGFFETGRNVLRVEQGDSDLVRVYAEDVQTKEQLTYEADAVIAADGSNSTIRWQLNPNLRRQEPGYVLWRGTVPTKELSQEILDIVDGRTTQCPMKHSYTIIYSIPGESGDFSPEGRLINFAWYTWPSASGLTIQDILTDNDGHLHHTTLPKGGMRSAIWTRQLEHAKATLPPVLHELASHVKDPFVSVVSSICAPQAAYFNDRLFLIGDAMCQAQPNSGQGTNLAAMDATLLAQVFAGQMSPEEWNKQIVAASQKAQTDSIEFANGLLC